MGVEQDRVAALERMPVLAVAASAPLTGADRCETVLRAILEVMQEIRDRP